MWVRQSWIVLPATALVVGIILSSGPVIGIAAFVLIAIAVGRIWADHVLANIRYERLMAGTRGFAGERIPMTLRLTNDKVLPVPWVEIRDLVPENLLAETEDLGPSPSPGQMYLRRSSHLGWYERLEWPVVLAPEARGYYRFGPTLLRSADPFGVFPVEGELDSREGLIVYPRTYTLPELGLPAERPFGERKGRERIFEDPSRIVGLRDYGPGDSMRRVDWKATARRQSLQSRVYDPSATQQLLVAVNVHTMTASWEGYIPEKLEDLLSAAASVAQYGFEAGYAVGLAANGAYPTSDRPMRVPAGRHPDQLMRILEALAVIGPLTLTPLHAVIDAAAQSFPFGATLVCVTMHLDEALAASLQRVRGAGHAVTILSLADSPFPSSLDRIPVYELAESMRHLAGSAAASQ